MSRRLLTLISVCVMYLAAVAFADELVLVQVMHRHGARWAITNDNATAICGGAERICGQLNEQGKQMLVALGTHLRTAYGGTLLSSSTNYSQLESYTRSTRLDRTLQSADGLLRGLYPNMDAFFPVVNTVEFESDLLLLVDAQMSFHIPDITNSWPGYAPAPSYYHIFNYSELVTMGLETQQDGLCFKTTFTDLEYTKCALRLQDVAASLRAAATLDAIKYPKTSANWDRLCDLRRQFHTQLFTYDPTNEVHKARGNLGYNLASEIARNMYSAVGLSTPLAQFTKIIDYSAHDTTYMPLASAIGLNNASYMLPQFGQMFKFETYQAAVPYVRLYGGQPPQLPPANGDYTYDVVELSAYGMKIDGTVYTGMGNNPVSVEDFSRFVNSTAPTDTRGSCYLAKKMLENIDCDGATAPTNPNCIEYRTWCNQNGCPNGYVMNLVDLSCVPIDAKQLMTSGSAATMVAAAVAAGLLLGGGIVQAIHACRRKSAGYQSADGGADDRN